MAATSFKQQCPSCEAMVPIKDASLVGRKIECPKCKYRFVVEEPEANEEDDDRPAKPAKKGRAGANGRGAGRAAVQSKPISRRRSEEEEDEDEPQGKQAGGGVMMALGAVGGVPVLPVAVGLVALVALVVVGVVLFKGSNKNAGTVAQQTPTNPNPQPARRFDVAPKPAAPAPPTDITNLLPNDTEAVVNLPMEQFRDSPVGAAAIDTPGAFPAGTYLKSRLGITEKEMERVLVAGNLKEQWLFIIVRTREPYDFAAVQSTMGLTKQKPIEGRDYYLAGYSWLENRAPILRADPASWEAGGSGSRPLAVFPLDSKTLVLGDEAPVRHFLEVKAQPQTTEKAAEAAQPSTPSTPSPTTPPQGMARPRVIGDNIGGGAPTQVGGGIGGGAGGRNQEEKIPPSKSYLTIKPSLKAMLDRVEYDKGGKPQFLASVANDMEADRGGPFTRLATSLGLRSTPKAMALSLQMKDGGLICKAALDCRGESAAKEMRAEVHRGLEGYKTWAALLGLKLEFEDQPARPGTPGAPPGVPPSGILNPPPNPANPDDRLAGALERIESRVGNKGTAKVHVSQQDHAVQVVVDCQLTPEANDALPQAFAPLWIAVKGQIDMASAHWGVHELAGSVKAVQDGGKFPRGAWDRKTSSAQAELPWPPEERVSFIAELLPFLESNREEYNRIYNKIDHEKSWADRENLEASVTLIPQLLSPLSPQSSWRVRRLGRVRAEYPGANTPRAATHFVGIAGVGLDAPSYRGDEPALLKKLGILGYNRVTSMDDIKDGASNTIFMIQVPATANGVGIPGGPWIAGGGSTLRGVPEKNSIRPFVSTEYNGKRGTFALMGDGSVRFVAADVNDQAFQALCTINGGEPVDLDRDAPLVPAPKGQAELKASALASQPLMVLKQQNEPDNRPKAETADVDEAGWKKFVSAAGRFEVMLPPPWNPTDGRDPFPTQVGNLDLRYHHLEPRKGTQDTYRVGWVDWGGQPNSDLLFTWSQNTWLKLTNGTFTNQLDIKLDGKIPGHAIDIQVPGNKKLRLRMFLVNQRMYMIWVLGSPEFVFDANANKFIGSFKLK